MGSNTSSVAQLIQLAEYYKTKTNEISIAQLDINKKYLNHDYFTDIITFDYSEDMPVEGVIAGDLFISIDTVARNAFQYRVRFKQELHRVIIHGILHLLGYKDKSATEAVEMRAKEDYYLGKLEL
ncbi:MAG: rRNA maturation RNase YbeY [Rikenellaceae bacterium]